jgi:hypothetical protein
LVLKGHLDLAGQVCLEFLCHLDPLYLLLDQLAQMVQKVLMVQLVLKVQVVQEALLDRLAQMVLRGQVALPRRYYL